MKALKFFTIRLINILLSVSLLTVYSLLFIPRPAGAQINSLSPLATFNSETWSGFGYDTASGVDINGDGYNDVIVGAYGYNSAKGRVYLYYGGASINNNADVIFSGDSALEQAGQSVAGADVNSDGYDDVIVGAYWYNSQQGRVYIFYGGPSLGNKNSSEADVVLAGQAGDRFGQSVAGADVNGDGYDDVIVGAYWYNSQQGRVYIFHGSSSMDSTADTVIVGETGGRLGRSVSSADVNGDGYDDVIMGSYGYDNNSRQGRTYIFYGSGSGISTQAATGADVIFTGDPSFTDYFGGAVSSVGDVNNDGYDDVVIGSLNGDLERAYLFYGAASGTNKNAIQADAIFTTENSGDKFGGLVGNANDLNNDGYDDILIFADTYDTNKGRAYIFFGGSSKLNSTSAVNANVIITGKTAQSPGLGDSADGNAFAAGDVNNDGWQELIMASPWIDFALNLGRAYIYSLNYASPSISTQGIKYTNDPKPDILSSASQNYPYNLGGIQWSFNNLLPGSWGDCTSSDGEYNSTSETGSCEVKSSDLREGHHQAYFRSYDTNSVYLPSRYYSLDDFVIDYTSPSDFSLIGP